MPGVGDDTDPYDDELAVEKLESYESNYPFIDTYMDAMASGGYDVEEQKALADNILSAFGPGESPNHSTADREAAIDLLAEYGFTWDWDEWRRDMEYNG